MFAVLIPLGLAKGIFLSVLRSFERIGWFSFLSQFLENFLKVAFLTILIIMGIGANAVAFSYAIGITIVLFSSYLVCKKETSAIFKKSNLKKSERKKEFSKLVSYSWPLIFFGLSMTLFRWTDTLVIGIFNSVKDVGFYNVAVPISFLLTLPQDLFMGLFLPIANKEYAKKNLSLVNHIGQQIWKWIFIISLPLFILLFLFPGVFINFLFGGEYLVAEQALRILSVGAFITGIFWVSKELILVTGKSKLILKDLMVFVVFNLLLNLILVPKFGINGAAFSTTLSLVLLNATFLFQIRKHFSIICKKRDIVKILLSAIIPTVLLLFIRTRIHMNIFNLIILGIGFVLIYSFMIIKLRCLDKNDKEILRAIIRKVSFSK
jgi:O-antigen/teichoic acid export membrane protein